MTNDIIEFQINYFPAVFINNEPVEQRGEIIRWESFKAKINSNEITGHNRPHVHIEYKNMNLVCSIDNVIEVIAPNNVKNSIKKYIVKMMAFPKNLKLAREEWNNCCSLYKFTEQQINPKKTSINYNDCKAYISILE